MARLEDFDELGRDYFLSMPMPEFDGTPWIEPPPVTAARIALISTAGLQRRGDRPFSVDSADFRLIPGDRPASDLVMSHISTAPGFRRTSTSSYRSTGCVNWRVCKRSALSRRCIIRSWAPRIRRSCGPPPAIWLVC
jgi:hypothetical protein